ncbi:Holliday junction branch migration protein RuvA, partial [Phocaeicola vulgatus]
MIEYIKGDIAEITPATVVLDCNGMGYGINISLNTYSAIQNQSNTKLYIYEAIR